VREGVGDQLIGGRLDLDVGLPSAGDADDAVRAARLVAADTALGVGSAQGAVAEPDAEAGAVPSLRAGVEVQPKPPIRLSAGTGSGWASQSSGTGDSLAPRSTMGPFCRHSPDHSNGGRH
jgi:hypothetical protein